MATTLAISESAPMDVVTFPVVLNVVSSEPEGGGGDGGAGDTEDLFVPSSPLLHPVNNIAKTANIAINKTVF